MTLWKRHLRFAGTVGRQQVEALALIRRGNRFEELLGRRRQDFLSLCTRLRAAGLLEPRLTGSGSAVYGIVPRGASIREIVVRFSGSEQLFVVRSARRGLRLRFASATRPGNGNRAVAPPTSGGRRRRTRAS